MNQSYSAAMTFDVHAEAASHLIRKDRQEDLCFAVWHPSKGANRTTALIHRLILPRNGERRVHGNASFESSYFERAIGEAVEAEGGLAFLHSHPAPGWQDMSSDDIRAEQGHAAPTMGATGAPLVGLTIGTDGAWSARFWEKVQAKKYERRWCENVRVVGDPFSITYADKLKPPPLFKQELRRTISAWGKSAQDKLARLRVGVVGAGSVGSIVAEALARSGIGHITLIDFDTVENINLDRLLHATVATARRRESKVRSLAQGLRKSATADGFLVAEVDRSIAEEEGYRAALDCDILFSCVDRPWGRAVLNFIAYAHLIPVIDGGILVEVTPKGTLRRADWKIHTVMPTRRCLECLEQYNPGLVQAEREGYLDDPQYIKGLPEDHPIKRNENVIAFSFNVGSFEVLQMLSMVVAPLGISDPGQQSYHFVPGIFDTPKFEVCLPNCPYPTFIALGDHAGFTVTGRHKIAEEHRAKHFKPPKSLLKRISNFFSAGEENS
jgi:molybdopterin-synthase adenylyltransferase